MRKRGSLGFTLLMLAGSVLAVSSWSSVRKISTHPDNIENHDFFPRIACDTKGNSYVAWTGWDGTDYDIYWVKITSGVPGTVQKISVHPDNVMRSDFSPHIAVDASGNSYVVWDCHAETGYHVYWVKIDSSGTPGAVQKISIHPDNVNGINRYPKIAVDTVGNSYVVWQGWNGYDDDVYWVKINPSGVPGSIQRISAYPGSVMGFDSAPQIGLDALGNSHIVWEGFDFYEKDIYWVRIDSSGTPGIVKKISVHPDNIKGFDWSPHIDVDAAENSYVVWSGWDGTDYDIYWVKITSSTPGTVRKISVHPDNVMGSDNRPRIAVDTAGNSHVVWDCWYPGSSDIYWVNITSSTPGTVRKISTHPDNESGTDWNPQIDLDAQGNSYIVWEGDDGTDQEIYWVRISSGVPGRVLKISTHPDNITMGEGSPHIAVDTKGNSHVVWHGYDENDAEIYATTSANLVPLLSDSPKEMNEQMRPLAQYRLSKAEELAIEAQALLSRVEAKGLDVSDAKELIEKAEEYCEMAQEYFTGGHYIAANIYALRAIHAYEEAIEFLKNFG